MDVFLVAVVVAFFICWAPFHAQRLMTIYIREDQWTPLWLELQSHLFYISGNIHSSSQSAAATLTVLTAFRDMVRYMYNITGILSNDAYGFLACIIGLTITKCRNFPGIIALKTSLRRVHIRFCSFIYVMVQLKEKCDVF